MIPSSTDAIFRSTAVFVCQPTVPVNTAAGAHSSVQPTMSTLVVGDRRLLTCHSQRGVSVGSATTSSDGSKGFSGVPHEFSATLSSLSQPRCAVADPTSFNGDGSAVSKLVVCDAASHGIYRVSLSLTDDAVCSVDSLMCGGTGRGFADGHFSAAKFNVPSSLAWNSEGTVLFVGDFGNCAIRAVLPALQVVRTVAGVGFPGYVDGPAEATLLRQPTALLSSPFGVFFCDGPNHAIRHLRIHAEDLLDPANYDIRRNSQVSRHRQDHHGDDVISIRPLSACRGEVLTLIGGHMKSGYSDGDVRSAVLQFPTSLAFHADGSLLFTDRGNDAVRRVSDGHVRTVISKLDYSTSKSMPQGLRQPTHIVTLTPQADRQARLQDTSGSIAQRSSSSPLKSRNLSPSKIHAKGPDAKLPHPTGDSTTFLLVTSAATGTVSLLAEVSCSSHGDSPQRGNDMQRGADSLRPSCVVESSMIGPHELEDRLMRFCYAVAHRQQHQQQTATADDRSMNVSGIVEDKSLLLMNASDVSLVASGLPSPGVTGRSKELQRSYVELRERQLRRMEEEARRNQQQQHQRRTHSTGSGEGNTRSSSRRPNSPGADPNLLPSGSRTSTPTASTRRTVGSPGISRNVTPRHTDPVTAAGVRGGGGDAAAGTSAAVTMKRQQAVMDELYQVYRCFSRVRSASDEVLAPRNANSCGGRRATPSPGGKSPAARRARSISRLLRVERRVHFSVNDDLQQQQQHDQHSGGSAKESITLLSWWSFCIVSGIFRSFQEAAACDANEVHNIHPRLFSPEQDPRAIMVRVYENGCVRRGYHTVVQMDFKRFRQCLLTTSVLGKVALTDNGPSPPRQLGEADSRTVAQQLMKDSNVVETYASIVAAYHSAEMSQRGSTSGDGALLHLQRDVLDLLMMNEGPLWRLYDAHTLGPDDPGFAGAGGPRKMPFSRFQSLFHSLAVYPTLTTQLELKRCFAEACCTCLFAPAQLRGDLRSSAEQPEGNNNNNNSNRPSSRNRSNSRPRSCGGASPFSIDHRRPELLPIETIQACCKTQFMTFVAFVEGFVRVALSAFSTDDGHYNTPSRKLTALLEWSQKNIGTFPKTTLRKLNFTVFEDVIAASPEIRRR
jgi:hypothetical protein